MALLDYLILIKFALRYVMSLATNRLIQLPRVFLHRFTYKPGPYPKNVVIVGGSFAGIFLAKNLSETLPSGHKIILIEKNSHFFFPFVFPRYSVVGGHEPKAFIPYDEILSAGRKGVPKGIFTRRRDTAVKVTKDSIHLSSGDSIPYEYLAIATGTTSPRPSRLKSDEKHGACEELRATQEEIRAAQRIAVIGGGAVGVELATDIKSHLPDKSVTIVHSRDRLMHTYGERLHERVLSEMKKMGIKVLLGQRPQILAQKTENGEKTQSLQFPNGEVETFDLVIPCIGQTPNTSMLAHQFPDVISPDTGRIMVDSTMQVVSNQGTLSNIFALGDVVQIGPNMGRAAMAQAGIVARNITALINGSRAESLYKPVLEIEAAINLTLGKSSSVLYSADGKGAESLISAPGHDDADTRIWGLLGAKYSKEIAETEG